MADATISSTSIDQSGHFNARSMRETQMAHEKDYGPDYVTDDFRPPQYMVYVYSVVDPRPIGKKLRRALPPLIPELEIAELKPGERYTLVTTLPHPINQPLMRENGERYIAPNDARRVAMDIVNPDNLTLDQDRKVDPSHNFSEGNDFGRLGVFWSLQNPPTDEEIAKAVARKEAYYNARLEQAQVIETSDPRALNNYISTTDHVAADYFGREFSWHRKMTRPEKCPRCGEPIQHGAAYHASGSLPGVICVISWQGAVNAGVKKLRDVPPDERWWTEGEAAE
jgi:hypothetical protein